MHRARSASDPEELDRESAPPASDDPALDLSDVPAAVVCALCGQPDCPGCRALEEVTHASGVVAIVPWERPGMPLSSRLWATAKLATLSPREMFAALPDGGLRAPLGFALLAEFGAVLGIAPCLGVLGLLAPDVTRLALSDPELRALALRLLFASLPSLAVLMVALHALHGILVDAAARRAGSMRRGRGLRFGLYACGWDLVTLPLGLLGVLLSDGPQAAARAAASSLSAPGQATRAYLSGFHALPADRARRAGESAGRRVMAAGALGLGLLIAFVIAVVR